MQINLDGKLLIILNPIAGKGKAIRLLPVIENFLKTHKQQFEIVLSKCPNDALEIARTCSLDEDTVVVAAGGDGTANEVANGLLRRGTLPFGKPTMAVLPVGRGNDFSSNVKVGEDLNIALDTLVARKTGALDVGLVTGGNFPDGRFFVNGIGIGFDTKVGFEAAKMKIKSGISYVLGAIITVVKYDPSPVVKIQYDENEVTLPAVLISIMNGIRMGGTFIMAPKALIDDGAFDICFVRHARSRLRLMKLVSKYTSGTQGELPETTMGRAKHFHLTALEGGMAAHCDGETVCTEGKELVIECLPAALNLVRPA